MRAKEVSAKLARCQGHFAIGKGDWNDHHAIGNTPSILINIHERWQSVKTATTGCDIRMAVHLQGKGGYLKQTVVIFAAGVSVQYGVLFRGRIGQ